MPMLHAASDAAFARDADAAAAHAASSDAYRRRRCLMMFLPRRDIFLFHATPWFA